MEKEARRLGEGCGNRQDVSSAKPIVEVDFEGDLSPTVNVFRLKLWWRLIKTYIDAEKSLMELVREDTQLFLLRCELWNALCAFFNAAHRRQLLKLE